MKDYKSFLGEARGNVVSSAGLNRLSPEARAAAERKMKADGLKAQGTNDKGSSALARTDKRALPGSAEQKTKDQKSMPVSALVKKDDKGGAMFGKKKEGDKVGSNKGKLHNDKQDVGTSHYVPRTVNPEKKADQRTKKPNVGKILGNVYKTAKDMAKRGQGGSIGRTSGGNLNEPGTTYQ